MKSSIDARVTFSFKGEVYSPSSTLDLDACLERYGTLPSIHTLLANANGIDTYSYLYEVMEQAEIHFDNARGIAAECLKNGFFDVERFELKWRESRVLAPLQAIAEREMGVADLEQRAELKRALLQAYALGKEAGASGGHPE